MMSVTMPSIRFSDFALILPPSKILLNFARRQSICLLANITPSAWRGGRLVY